MKGLSKSLPFYRIAGGTLVFIALIGYFTVADEFHHFGEFLGITCILVSGLILLFIDSGLNRFKHVAFEWIAFCLIASIPVGGILLDNMPIGIAIGLSAGIIIAVASGKTKSQGK